MNYTNIAKSQFKDRISGDLLSIDVPEWKSDDGETVKIFYKPATNFKIQGQLLRLVHEGKPDEAIIMQFILRSLNQDGKQIWRKINMNEIMYEFDPDVVSRVVNAMNEGEPDEGEALKS
jgi:hypothetical protein